MPDYIPGADQAFDGWQANFVSIVNANLSGYGLVAADLTPIVAAQTTWHTALPAHFTAANAAQAAREAKDTARSTLEAGIRAVVRKIQASPTVTASAKAAACGAVKQRLYVIPTLKLVVVRQGSLSQGFSDIEFLSLLLRGKSAGK